LSRTVITTTVEAVLLKVPAVKFEYLFLSLERVLGFAIRS
jgi:hypothetical protein